MRTNHTKLMAALVAALLFVAGCSGDDSEGSSGSDDVAADDDGGEVAGDAEAGRELYLSSCQSCHGADAAGIDGLGMSLSASEFIASTSAADLVDLVKLGRSPSDPANTTGLDMPAKGGNSALSDDDIADIVAYMKSLN